MFVGQEKYSGTLPDKFELSWLLLEACTNIVILIFVCLKSDDLINVCVVKLA